MKRTRNISTAVVIVILAIFALLLMTSKIFLLQSFAKLEEEQGRRSVERVLDMVGNELSAMNNMAYDWAEWDEAYAFIKDGNPLFVKRNLADSTFKYVNASVIIYITNDGRVRYGKEVDRSGKAQAPLSTTLLENTRAVVQLLKQPRYRQGISGVLMLPDGPLLVASHPVVDSQGKGVSYGVLLMGRRLDEVELKKLSRMAQVSASLNPITGEFRSISQTLEQFRTGVPPVFVRTSGETTAAGYGLLRDIHGKPALIVKVDLPRYIYGMGKEAVLYFLAWIMGIITLSLLGGSFLYKKLSLSHRGQRDSDARYRAVIRQTSDGILLAESSNGQLLEVNDAMLSMIGCAKEDINSLRINDIIPNFSTSVHVNKPDREIAPLPVARELPFQAKNGRQILTEVSADIISYESKEALCVIVRDITDRKRAEIRLAKLNDCFLDFSTDSGENIRKLTTLCGELMDAACALYNRLDDGMLCTTAQWNAPPDFAPIDRAQGHICHDVIQKGGKQVVILRDLLSSEYARTDPNVNTYSLKTYIGAPVRCGGNTVGSLCVVYQKDYSPSEEDRRLMEILAVAVGVEEERKAAEEALLRANDELETRVGERTVELSAANERLGNDIEERKKVEARLRQEESIRRMILESIPDLIAVIDRDFRIIHSNWGTGYDYVPKEIRDSSPYCYDAFYPGQGRCCEQCHVTEAFATGKPVFTEKINPRTGYMEVRAYPVFDETGNVILVVEHIRNITDKKQREEEQLKAQKLESIGVLAGGIAHDFNNLLTSVLGNISLAKTLADPEGRIFLRLEYAEKACQRASDLTRQLLTFSRGGAPVKKAASIEQLLTESVLFALRGSNVRCDFSIRNDLLPVEVDAGQMTQVLNNLIINADQAMPDGGVITVRAENTDIGPESPHPLSPGRYVRITVQDHGTGIPEAHLDKIFDPYFTTKAKGNGLGLATVYSIIKKHDGLVTVESQEGEGTTFQIYLPAGKNLPAKTDDPVMNSPEGTGRILVMDDEEIIREVVGEILAHLGYSAEFCRDGIEAIRMYEKARKEGAHYEAILIDLTIPGGMGGKETMKRLLELDPDVKGIVSSGYSNDPILGNYKDYGFRGVVMKPYNIGELARTLQNVLNAPMHSSAT